MSAFFCVLLSCVSKHPEMGRSPVHVALPKSLNVFAVSEINSESV